ncbi:unnamed protein product [Sphagnum compactum]
MNVEDTSRLEGSGEESNEENDEESGILTSVANRGEGSDEESGEENDKESGSLSNVTSHPETRGEDSDGGFSYQLPLEIGIMNAAELNLANTHYVPGVGRMSNKAYAVLMDRRKDRGEGSSTQEATAAKPKRHQKDKVEENSTERIPASKPKQRQKKGS